MTKGISNFVTFRQCFYDAVRHFPRFEREFLRIMNHYAVSQNVSEEMKRDFAIFYARFFHLRKKLFIAQNNVEAASVAISKASSTAFDLEQLAYQSYNNWYSVKVDFRHSLEQARRKWETIVNT